MDRLSSIIDIHKITWISNDHRTKSQVDHLAIGPRWRAPCLQDVKVYRGADTCSDYHLVIAKLKIKLKRQKPRAAIRRRFDTTKSKDPKVAAQYSAFMSNKYSALAESPPPGTIEWWEGLKETATAAGEEILGYRKTLRESWISD